MTKKMTVEVLVYPPFKSAWVMILHGDGRREDVMSGNYHDFHPGCHGITKYGSFHGPLDLGYCVARHLTSEGCEATVERRTVTRDEFDELMSTIG
jgi:hypothetical protein